MKGFRNDAEAEPLYHPRQEEVNDEKLRFLEEVAERYNTIIAFIKKFDKD